MWRSHLCVSLLCVQPFAEFRAFLVWRKLLKSHNVVTLAFIRSKKIRYDFSLHRRKSWNWMNIPVLQKPSKTFWTLKSRGRPDDALFFSNDVFSYTDAALQSSLFENLSFGSLGFDTALENPSKSLIFNWFTGCPNKFCTSIKITKNEKFVKVCLHSC